MVLECHVTVRRVEHLESWFGLGCHIEDYSVGGGVLAGDASRVRRHEIHRGFRGMPPYVILVV
jgi:hypothetical protein